MPNAYQTSIFDNTAQSMLNKSIQLIRNFEDAAIARNPLGYVVGYSGGKDSDVLVYLFRRAGVRFCLVHNHTTLDAPETVYYIRRKFAEFETLGIPCKIFKPQRSYWQICKSKLMLPTRRIRFCCGDLKEAEQPELRYAMRAFGVRKAESPRRKELRDSIETRNAADYSDVQKFHFDNTEDVRQTGACYTNHYFFVNPLAYWDDAYLWACIDGEKIEVNLRYKCSGCNRIGCIIGCPMCGPEQRKLELEEFPKYKAIFLRLA